MLQVERRKPRGEEVASTCDGRDEDLLDQNIEGVRVGQEGGRSRRVSKMEAHFEN